MRNSLVLISVLILVPQMAAAQVVISEIMYDAPGSDAKTEWVELQNVGPEAVDISKWKFNDGSNHVLNAPPKNGSTGSMSIPPGAFVILAADAAVFLSKNPISASVIDTTMSLGNDGGKISIIGADGTTEDKASYSTSKGGDGTGESLQVVNGKWAHAKPTPGSENSSERIIKAASVTVKKTAKSAPKVASQKARPQIIDGTSTVRTVEVSPEVMTAAAVVPVSSDNSFLPWAFGALSIGVAGAGAVFASRQKKKGEWDIEEIDG